MFTKDNLLIIGAGLSGLSAAHHLKKDFLLFEKENHPGGTASSRNIDGFIFDKTGHLLHFQTEYVKDLLNSLSNGCRLLKHKRSSWVFSNRTYTRYPFQSNTYRLSPQIIKECVVKMAEHQSRPKDIKPRNFKGWILDNLGEGVAKHFMFPYNQKLWKVPLDKIDIDWVERFIPRPTLEEAIKGAVSDFKKNFGYNKIFYYPRYNGIQGIAEMLVGSKKDKLRFSKEVAGIDIKKKILTLADGKSERFEKIVSTMPLPELVRIIINCPKTVRDKASRLRYVSVFNLNLGINRADISDKHWIYFPEKRYIFYRVGFASNFSRHIMPPGTSSIYTEVSYTKDRPLRHTHQALKKRIIGDLKGLGILTAGDEIIAEKIYDIKYAYPVHDIKRERLVSDIKYFLNQHNIYSIGRYGSWRYMTMEECILEGKYVAEILNEP